MRKPQSEKDQAYIIIDNFIESIMSWCEVIVVAIKNEDYERAQDFKDSIEGQKKTREEEFKERINNVKLYTQAISTAIQEVVGIFQRLHLYQASFLSVPDSCYFFFLFHFVSSFIL